MKTYRKIFLVLLFLLTITAAGFATAFASNPATDVTLEPENTLTMEKGQEPPAGAPALTPNMEGVQAPPPRRKRNEDIISDLIRNFKFSDENLEGVDDKKLSEEAVKRELSKAIPAGGLIYMNWIDLKGVHEGHVKPSNSYNKFTSLLSKMYEELKMMSPAMSAINGGSDKPFSLEDSINLESILKLFGYNFFVSVYQLEGKKEPDMILSISLKDPTYIKQISDYIEKEANKINNKTGDDYKKLPISKETYKDHEIEYIEVNKRKHSNLYFLMIDRIAHFSADIDLIKKIVDISKGDSDDSIANFEGYKKIDESRSDERLFTVFFDFTVLAKMLPEVQNPNPNDAVTAELYKGLKSYRYLYGDMTVNDGLDVEAELTFKDDESSEYMKQLDRLFSAPGKSSFINMIKSAPISFTPYIGISIKEYYDLYVRSGPPGTYAALEQSFNEFTKMSLYDQVLPMLDDEAVILFNGIDTSSPFMPLPKLLIGFKLKQEDEFHKVYENINTSLHNPQKNMMVMSEEYGGSKFSYTMIPPGIILGHGIISDYYAIFLAPSTFKDIVDGSNAKDGAFSKNEEYAELSKHLYKDYHYLSYVDTKLFLDQLPVLYEKYSGLLMGKMGEKEKDMISITVNNYVLPLIDTMTVMNRGISSGYYDKEKKRFLLKTHYSFKDIAPPEVSEQPVAQ
jgi:hypothetical protein